MSTKSSNAKQPKVPSGDRFKAAVVQACPVIFDRERTLKKVHTLAREAADQGARLVVFPEAFVSAYPRGLDFGAVIGSRSERRSRAVPPILGEQCRCSRAGRRNSCLEPRKVLGVFW